MKLQSSQPIHGSREMCLPPGIPPSPRRGSSPCRVLQDLEVPPAQSSCPLPRCPKRSCPVGFGTGAGVPQQGGGAVPGVLVRAAAPLSHRSLPQAPAPASGPPSCRWRRVWVCYVNWGSASWFTESGSSVHASASQTAILSSHTLGSHVFRGGGCLLGFSTQQHRIFWLCPGRGPRPDVNGARC